MNTSKPNKKNINDDLGKDNLDFVVCQRLLNKKIQDERQKIIDKAKKNIRSNPETVIIFRKHVYTDAEIKMAIDVFSKSFARMF